MNTGNMAVIELDCVVETTELEFDCEVVYEIVLNGGGAIWYNGPYDFTPSTARQTIEIANKTAIDDITIEPIPSNYGLITWNGAVLTVS